MKPKGLVSAASSTRQMSIPIRSNTIFSSLTSAMLTPRKMFSVSFAASAVRALSAGTRPQPKVADGAIAALKLAGLPTDGLHPKDIDAVMNEAIDLVVTVCDNAKEACPIFPKPIPAIHLPFHDPHGEPLESFLAVRDDIRTRLVAAVREKLGLQTAVA